MTSGFDRVVRGLSSDFFFLQIGANDGVDGDPIRPYILELGWRGVLVEPLPDVFALLQKNYSGIEGLRFVNAAVTEESGEVTMWRHPTKSVCSGLRVQTMRQRAVEMERVVVKSIALRELLQSIDKLDLLQIDVEGYDGEILKMWCWDLFHPRVIQFERKHLSLSERKVVGSVLKREGYRCWQEGSNTVCVLGKS
jgi:FkbM family methyltransferase